VINAFASLGNSLVSTMDVRQLPSSQRDSHPEPWGDQPQTLRGHWFQPLSSAELAALLANFETMGQSPLIVVVANKTSRWMLNQ